MLYILAAVVIIGIVSALIVLLKGMKEIPAVPLPETKSSAAPVGKVLPSVSETSVPKGMDKVDTFEERCGRIEKLLDEKSREVTRLEQELKNELLHREEFETMKDIYQRQIEDLKANNRMMKEEIGVVLKENAELQTRLGTLALEKTSMVVAQDLIPDTTKIKPVFNIPEVPQDVVKISSKSTPTLSLHDVFDDNKG